MNNQGLDNNACTVDIIDWEQALLEANTAVEKGYHYALVQRISELFLCLAEELPEYLKDDECIEIRLFGEDKELHLIFGDEKRAVRAVDVASENTDENVLIRKYIINSRFLKNGLGDYKNLIVKQYLNVDQDGQVYVGLTRLQDVQ